MSEPARELGSSGLPPMLTLEKLFARGDYRPAMGLSPLDVAEYFKNGGCPELLAERQRLLASTPEDFVCECASEQDRTVVAKFARRWNPDLELGSFVKMGRAWEPDFILVDRHPSHSVLGGCVCFPSGWSLPEKFAQAVDLVHERVPALNELLGSHIGRSLARLEVDKFYQRAN